MFLKAFILLCAYVLTIVESARILGVFPIPSISHQVVYRSLTTELAKRGHEMVIITPDPAFPNNNSPYNITEIDTHDISYEHQQETMKELNESPNHIYDIVLKYLNAIYAKSQSLAEVQHFMKKETAESFELIIIEILSYSTLKWVENFNAPLIAMSSIDVYEIIFREVGVPTNPIAYPSIFEPKIKFSSFWERLLATIRHLHNEIVTSLALKELDVIARDKWESESSTVYDLFPKIDMLFLNLNHIWYGSRPVPPNVIFTGSLHLKPQNPLEDEFKHILAENKIKGIVYVSFGSNVLAKSLSKEKLQLLVDSFALLPYTVMWKYEEDSLPVKLPQNVITKKWFPQGDMFGHPSIKAFVTQCGQQSIDEAIRSHVPMVGLPFHFDQHKNGDRQVKFGIGIQLDFNTFTKEQFAGAVHTVIIDKSYKENITKLWNIMNDQPMSDIDRAVWWSEYLIRNKGAKHFRGPATIIPYYQIFLLDIIAFCLAIIVLTVYFLTKVSKIFKLLFVKTKTKTQ